jgi:hypothetical protein
MMVRCVQGGGGRGARGSSGEGLQLMCRGSVMNGWGVERGDGSHLSQLSQVGGS